VTGTNALTGRTLKLSVAIATAAGTRILVDAGNLTVWSLNGTVLVSNWNNGNNGALNSRIYLWNPNPTITAAITARVFTLGLSSSPSTQLGTVSLGSIGGAAGRNVRVAEDILTPLNVTLPYTTNGGNLVVEITIEAVGCSGIAQSFSNAFAYGTVALTKIQ
jgi:hypothetical protein